MSIYAMKGRYVFFIVLFFCVVKTLNAQQDALKVDSLSYKETKKKVYPIDQKHGMEYAVSSCFRKKFNFLKLGYFFDGIYSDNIGLLTNADIGYDFSKTFMWSIGGEVMCPSIQSAFGLSAHEFFPDLKSTESFYFSVHYALEFELISLDISYRQPVLNAISYLPRYEVSLIIRPAVFLHYH